MKKNIMQYVKVVVRLPLMFVGGFLLLAGIVINVIASLFLCKLSDAGDYLETIK